MKIWKIVAEFSGETTARGITVKAGTPAVAAKRGLAYLQKAYGKKVNGTIFCEITLMEEVAA